jgi:hypothetical protein
MPIHSKNKGNKFELQIVQFLERLGFEAVTSRSESKRLDDKGVDIVTNAPFNIQCKAVERLSIPIHQLLKDMPTDKPPVVFHKRNNKGVIVSMKLEDFEKLIKPKNNETTKIWE